jgi:6-phosphogluconolactonase (cycloisomerase 2 family)
MTIEISDIKLFTLLKEKIGEREATSLIDFVKQETRNSVVKTKELMSKDIASLQIHIDERFRFVDEKFKSQEQSFALKISESKNEMMKAMYITSFIQIISIIGGLMALVKFMK